MDALAVFGEEVVELRGLAGGGDDEVAGVEGGPGEGAAEAPEEPVMNQICSILQYNTVTLIVQLCCVMFGGAGARLPAGTKYRSEAPARSGDPGRRAPGGRERGIRQVTLTEIAEEVGMHKSALLRYFETREEIFLRLTAEAWQEWSGALRAELGVLITQLPPWSRPYSPGRSRPGAPSATCWRRPR